MLAAALAALALPSAFAADVCNDFKVRAPFRPLRRPRCLLTSFFCPADEVSDHMPRSVGWSSYESVLGDPDLPPLQMLRWRSCGDCGVRLRAPLVPA